MVRVMLSFGRVELGSGLSVEITVARELILVKVFFRSLGNNDTILGSVGRFEFGHIVHFFLCNKELCS